MKYCVVDQLKLFQFHDAKFSFVSFDQKDLVVCAKHLNIHKGVKENPYNFDMEIECATVTFRGVEIRSLELLRAVCVNADGRVVSDDSEIFYKDNDAAAYFTDALKQGVTLDGIELLEDQDKTQIRICSIAPTCFLAEVAFDRVTVEWDEYRKKAWYEEDVKRQSHKYDITLITPNGDLATTLYINSYCEEHYHQGIPMETSIVDVSIVYEDCMFFGHGEDYDWVDAFADLQKQLPEGVILKCCLTCRHGNMCPYGNKVGEVFCTKDLTINSKLDMIDLFDPAMDLEMDRRSRHYTNTCHQYQPQTHDCYTYNDYLFLLDK